MVAFSDFQQSRTSSREKWRDELSTQEQGNETEQEAGFPLKLSSTLLRSTHRCLQCRHICTTREMKKHAIGKGHAFCEFLSTSKMTQRSELVDQVRVSDQDRSTAPYAKILFMTLSLNGWATRLDQPFSKVIYRKRVLNSQLSALG